MYIFHRGCRKNWIFAGRRLVSSTLARSVYLIWPSLTLFGVFLFWAYRTSYISFRKKRDLDMHTTVIDLHRQTAITPIQNILVRIAYLDLVHHSIRSVFLLPQMCALCNFLCRIFASLFRLHHLLGNFSDKSDLAMVSSNRLIMFAKFCIKPGCYLHRSKNWRDNILKNYDGTTWKSIVAYRSGRKRTTTPEEDEAIVTHWDPSCILKYSF